MVINFRLKIFTEMVVVQEPVEGLRKATNILIRIVGLRADIR
jgi:hypothetical protein